MGMVNNRAQSRIVPDSAKHQSWRAIAIIELDIRPSRSPADEGTLPPDLLVFVVTEENFLLLCTTDSRYIAWRVKSKRRNNAPMGTMVAGRSRDIGVRRAWQRGPAHP